MKRAFILAISIVAITAMAASAQGRGGRGTPPPAPTTPPVVCPYSFIDLDKDGICDHCELLDRLGAAFGTCDGTGPKGPKARR